MITLTDEQAAILVRFLREMVPDNITDEEAYGWSESDCDALDDAFDALGGTL